MITNSVGQVYMYILDPRSKKKFRMLPNLSSPKLSAIFKSCSVNYRNNSVFRKRFPTTSYEQNKKLRKPVPVAIKLQSLCLFVQLDCH